MRLPGLIILAALFTAGCSQKDTKSGHTHSGLNAGQTDTSQLTTIEWKESSQDLGKITEGQNLEVVFHFKNTGTRPLIINKVSPGCGCTVAETPTEPVLPGAQGEIKARFDSKNRVGTQHKSIYVNANTKGTQDHELVFEVEVEKNS